MTDSPISGHVYRRRVQFKETDASGIVHFTSFFCYAEEAEHAMWRAAGLSIAQADGEIGFPRVAASFEYFKPLRFEDEFEVRLRIQSKTRKTLQYRADICVGETVVARGAITCICVRHRPGEPLKAMDMPPHIAARFEVAEIREKDDREIKEISEKGE